MDRSAKGTTLVRRDDQPLVAAVLYQLRALSSAMDDLDQCAARQFGINRTDLRGLDVLGLEGPMSPTALAGALHLTTGGVTTVIDHLEALGYVSRRPDPSDRRRLILETTKRTGELSTQIFGPLIRKSAQGAKTYTAAELEAIGDFLERHRQAITSHVATMEGQS